MRIRVVVNSDAGRGLPSILQSGIICSKQARKNHYPIYFIIVGTLPEFALLWRRNKFCFTILQQKDIMMITHQIFKDNGQHQDGVEGQLDARTTVAEWLQKVSQESPEWLSVIVCDEVCLSCY